MSTCNISFSWVHLRFVVPERRFSAIAARNLMIDAYVLHAVLYLRLRHDRAVLLRTSAKVQSFATWSLRQIIEKQKV